MVLDETKLASSHFLNSINQSVITEIKIIIRRKTITNTVMCLVLRVMNLEVKHFKRHGSSFCNDILKEDLQTVKNRIALIEDVNEKTLGMTLTIFASRYIKIEIFELPITKDAKLKVRSDGYIGIKQ